MGHRAVLRARRAASSTRARGVGGGARGSLAEPAAELRGGAKGGARAEVDDGRRHLQVASVGDGGASAPL
jgi:hypothetical protein